MNSSNQRLRTNSEILEYLDSLPSEADPIDLLEDDENEDMHSIEVAMDMAALSESDSSPEDNDLPHEERLYDPNPEIQNAEDDEENDDCDWEEYDNEKPKLRQYPFLGKQQFFPPNDNMPTPLDFFNLFFFS